MIKTDSNGNQQWTFSLGKTGPGTSNDYCLSVVQTADGGYTLAGNTNSYGAGLTDAWLVRVDSTGKLEWNKTYGGAQTLDYCNSIIKTTDGGYALLGNSNNNVWLFKVDSSGNLEWDKKYDDLQIASAFAGTRDFGYVLTGDFGLAKVDSSDNIQWHVTLPDGPPIQ